MSTTFGRRKRSGGCCESLVAVGTSEEDAFLCQPIDSAIMDVGLMETDPHVQETVYRVAGEEVARKKFHPRGRETLP